MNNDIDLNKPLGTQVPGSEVYIEDFSFTHEMQIVEVQALFTNQDHPDEKIMLSGEPLEAEESSRGEAGQPIFYSTVKLEAVIPAHAEPGQYKCSRIGAVTATGKLVAFEDPPNEPVNLEFWVLVEPTTPPKFGIW